MGMFSHDEEDDAPPAECTYICKCGRCPKETEVREGPTHESVRDFWTRNPLIQESMYAIKCQLAAALARLDKIKKLREGLDNEERLLILEVEKAKQDLSKGTSRRGLPDLHDVGKMVQVFGYTFKVKDQLRALGGKWDPISKTWSVPKAKEAEAKRLIAPSRSTYRSGSGGYSFREEDRDDVDMLDHYRALYGDAAADGWGSD